MTIRYCGPGGDNGNSGLTWALRKLTLNGVEDIPVVAGDLVYAGPGVYREQLTVDVSGGNTYSTGTVSVTNGSKVVTGSGTTFGGNVAVDYMFHVRLYASGTDGVANGTSTFTSAAGNFQSGMIGKVVQVNTKGAYLISAVASATSITLSDPNSLGWPSAGSGLTYSVMSGEGHYDVESQDSNTQLTLPEPWNGPTLTGLSYLTFNPIRYIADVTGEHTDGVGGPVRITGSDNDQSAARSYCVSSSAHDYRVFRGINLDTASGRLLSSSSDDHWVLEDCKFQNLDDSIHMAGTSLAWTVRRCVFIIAKIVHLTITHSANHDDAGHVIESCLFAISTDDVVRVIHVGGLTFRNNLVLGSGSDGFDMSTSPTTGQAAHITNCIFACVHGAAVEAAVAGEIVENFNTFSANTTNRLNVGVGASSVTYPPLFSMPLLLRGFKFPWQFGELSEWSQVRAIAGSGEPAVDLLGIPRPATASKNSWGPIQFTDTEREIGTIHSGSASLKLADAGRIQIKRPVTAVSTTFSGYVYREANYTGNLPQMIIKQPGQADDITTDTNAASQWNLLTTTLTPTASPPWVIVELVSRNTTTSGNYDVFFDDLAVS